jgi:hypothetical protein
MALYFFIARRADIETDDPHGMALPDTAAALRHAEHIIDQLRKSGTFNDDLAIVVKNELHETILNIPFHPANA